MYRKHLKLYLKLMSFIAPVLLLLSIMIPIIFLNFFASNVYSFTDNQFPQTWLRNRVTMTIIRTKCNIFNEAFEYLKDKSLMVPFLSFSWKVSAEADSLFPFLSQLISSPLPAQKRQGACGFNLFVLQSLEQLIHTLKKLSFLRWALLQYAELAMSSLKKKKVIF